MPNSVTWLRNASPYINAHRGRVFVVMLPGEAMAHPNFQAIIHDLVLLHSLGVKLILVHGARPQIEQRLAEQQLASRYHQGLRITDGPTLNCVQQAVGQLRIQIEALLSTDMASSPMRGAQVQVVSGNWVTAKPIGVVEGVDLQSTGEVRRINRAAISQVLERQNIVLLSALGYSPTGEAFNLSAETVATQAALSLHADKLILFSPEPGIVDTKQQLLRELNLEQARQLAEQLPTTAPSRSLLSSAVQACAETVKRCHVVSYAEDGALLTELFTRDGSGTLISAGLFEQVREASIEDVGGLLELIRPLEEQGILVRRSRDLLEQEISHFSIVERDGTIIACAALYEFPQEQTGELACLAVHPEYRHGGRGDAVLERIEQRAQAQGLNSLFVLTTRTAHWFQERGFEPCQLEQLPQKKAELYNFQRNSKVFRKTLG
ncbi:N-acetylglutamate synthase [Thiopseudomonas alkaliphila]|uniref:amino-acid N-acetyltransferase n=1 Tax=Thiopseudomonas alkaliphila TaxID=1697053 RepID=UPI00069F46C5|nr:amino-acid N-acetyltransferase [Thiopseudomonas alkaliphila]AKX45271.1 N-acetylglutamate synthase [Thiopseudomonas alkaliphila]AKX47204.1 N-acetylglutamate synthase [Thiopseudomonas alkaliphila]AKX48572.1 N-acetylglutamate synthase [Thiopseudomonas alkaliphila]AKX53696.1 N-acetylglutamate synthase [Thiopseudomonas alkaliphila]AKX55331.1 N-acetylglutamate synthase [Thiopseudomonas alkaliphila]